MLNFKLQDEKNRIFQIPVESIIPNPYQPRQTFDSLAIEELANSIREYGVIQPITVRRIAKDMYELVTGERRLRAAKSLRRPTIPAMILNISDNDSAVIALIENLQRKELGFFEEAEGYYHLISDHGMTQEEVAAKTGKKQSTVANKLRILKLSPYLKKIVSENKLTERHCRALLRLPDEEMQWKALMKIVEKNMNVRAAEEYIDVLLGEKKEEEPTPPPAPVVKRKKSDYRIFLNTIDKALEMVREAGVKPKTKKTEFEDYYEYTIRIDK
ncbi:MAG: nucleoid occlusion protein [Clostridia bacterium]|nr:nucleoid occlusion protein [Oscillospiraceae bacterium]MBQ7032732.1 nucleoid occlusion protein [Clostridia bacterium]